MYIALTMLLSPVVRLTYKPGAANLNILTAGSIPLRLLAYG